MSTAPEYILRKGERNDCGEIFKMLRGLTAHMNTLDELKITAKDLEDDGFGSDPFFQCYVACDPKNPTQLLGYVLYYFTYSTWKGKAIHMEDIFVKPEYRGFGLGKALWKICVQAGLEKNCVQCNFSVQPTNTNSVKFYLACGAYNVTTEEGWHSFRMKEDQMKKFVSE